MEKVPLPYQLLFIGLVPNWQKQALIEVANKFIKDIELSEDKVREGLTEMCINVSVDVRSLWTNI